MGPGRLLPGRGPVPVGRVQRRVPAGLGSIGAFAGTKFGMPKQGRTSRIGEAVIGPDGA